MTRFKIQYFNMVDGTVSTTHYLNFEELCTLHWEDAEVFLNEPSCVGTAHKYKGKLRKLIMDTARYPDEEYNYIFSLANCSVSAETVQNDF